MGEWPNRTRSWAAVGVLLLLGGAGWGQDARSLYAEGEKAQIQGNYDLAIELYRQSLSANEHYHQPMIGLAECYFVFEEYEEALRHILRAAKYAQGDTRVLNTEARIRIGLGDIQGAAGLFAEVLSREPHNLDARFGQAELDIASGNKQSAASRYLESLQVAPTSRKALVSLAVLYQDLGEAETASRYIALALKYHAGDPVVHFAAGNHFAAENPQRAVGHLQTAIAMDPTRLEPRYVLAGLYLESDRFEDVRAVLQPIVEQGAAEERTWYLFGLAYRGEGRVADAIEALSRALEIRTDRESIRLALEDLCMAELDLDHELRASLSAVHVERGDLLESKNYLERAYVEYRRALLLSPESGPARMAFASIHRALGFPQKYLRELEVLRDLGLADRQTLNEIEVRSGDYDDTVGADWGIDQFGIDRHAVRLAVTARPGRLPEQLTVQQELLIGYLRSMLLRYEHVSLTDIDLVVDTYEKAFRSARTGGADYFVWVDFDEGERSFGVQYEIFLARTGALVDKGQAHRTGNDRVRDTLLKVGAGIAGAFPAQGELLRREFDRGLVDLGRMHGVAPGDELLILRKDSLRLATQAIGYDVQPESRVGSFIVERVDEGVCDGAVQTSGFFDLINPGDSVIYAPQEIEAAPPEPEDDRGLLRRLLGIP